MRTPKPVATSSPNAKAFNAVVKRIPITMPTIRNGDTVIIPSHVAPLTLPTCQNRNAFITSVLGNITALTREDKAALVAAPARASFIGVAPP